MSLERLRTIRDIDGVIVKFEKYMFNRNGITQCANCLRFSHGARNCHLPPRCVRCGANHASKECNNLIVSRDLKSRIPPEKVKCANCKGQHTANYEKCPERQKFLVAKQSVTRAANLRENHHHRAENRRYSSQIPKSNYQNSNHRNQQNQRS